MSPMKLANRDVRESFPSHGSPLVVFISATNPLDASHTFLYTNKLVSESHSIAFVYPLSNFPGDKKAKEKFVLIAFVSYPLSNAVS